MTALDVDEFMPCIDGLCFKEVVRSDGGTIVDAIDIVLEGGFVVGLAILGSRTELLGVTWFEAENSEVAYSGPESRFLFGITLPLIV